MKPLRTLLALTLTIACLGIIGLVTVNAINPEPSVHGAAQSGDLMFTVSAVQHQDGSVDGHATFRDRAANIKVDVDVDCLSAGGGMMGGGGSTDAILSGVVTKSTSPDFVEGDQVAFGVRDNGEGQNAPPDQFTPPSRAKGPCFSGKIGGLLDSDRGNLVIEPGTAAN
jgi:hypothetical protein